MPYQAAGIRIPATRYQKFFCMAAARIAINMVIARLNPMLYMINSFRYGMLGVSDISITTGLTVIVTFTVTLFIIAYYLLKTGKGIRD